MKTIQLTEQEQSIIENALNAYYNDAMEQLLSRKNELGDIERKLLTQRTELTLPLIYKIEKM